MDNNSLFIGGALGMSYQSMSIKNRILAWLNNARARWLMIAFGDQGQFFRRAALDQIGGFPKQMLMEDVELSMRLKDNGMVCFISHGIEVSERRWERVGFWKNIRRVVTLCLSYLIQRRFGSKDTTMATFYRRYYDK
jgi:cellulose synthase/poly-beta-1,6-N-acetylglucosamine synthase-like glycosyltransferase